MHGIRIKPLESLKFGPFDSVPGYKDLAELLPAYFFSESEVMSELEIRQELSKMIDRSTCESCGCDPLHACLKT